MPKVYHTFCHEEMFMLLDIIYAFGFDDQVFDKKEYCANQKYNFTSVDKRKIEWLKRQENQNIEIVSGSLVMTTLYREVFMCNIDSHPLSVGGSVSTSATKKKAKG